MNLYELGKMLGIDKEEIDEIMKRAKVGEKEIRQPLDTYKGGRYGVIGIEDV